MFLGVMVPEQRKIAKQYQTLQLHDVKTLLKSRIHEERLTGLLILIYRYQTGSEAEQKRLVTLYLNHLDRVNNWDLVDLSAPPLLGNYLLDKDRKVLYLLARSPDLWEKRVSIVATAAFIKHHQFADTLAIAALLLHDKHDLIHKAVGWMLREVGKKDQKAEETFLLKHYHEMPRTMLRYAIERFDKAKRKHFLQKK